MSDTLTTTLAQLNPTVGDIVGNIDKILNVYKKHKDTSDLIIFSEMVVSGYPTDDLVLKPFFIDHVMQGIDKLAKEINGSGAALLISAPWQNKGKLYNAALLIHDGKVIAERYKHNLPNYGVFDEVRVFTAGELPQPIEFKGIQLGVLTCEDTWHPDVTKHLHNNGAEILITLNGSPYEYDKIQTRFGHAGSRVKETELPLIYINQVGGQDELVFDGASFVLDHTGKKQIQFPSHVEHISTMTWGKNKKGTWHATQVDDSHALYTGNESIYQTLVLGLRDYVNKTGFPGVLIGMSGGIDSAISAAIAVDALGADRVRTFMLPSPYTSQESLDDAAECCELLGISHGTVSIEPAMHAFDIMLKQAGNANTGVTSENLQSRSRGVFLMAMSNTTGYMVLSTGNKSEMSVGYATLYGDMAGGFNALKDVYKTTVFELSNWRNQHHPQNALGPKGAVIPDRIIIKPPSAELRPDQKDEDSLPPYDVLDDILHCLIEEEMGLDDIAARKHDPATISKIWKLVDGAVHKRYQSCPGVKISSKAFGRDRRYPIVNKFVV